MQNSQSGNCVWCLPMWILPRIDLNSQYMRNKRVHEIVNNIFKVFCDIHYLVRLSGVYFWSGIGYRFLINVSRISSAKAYPLYMKVKYFPQETGKNSRKILPSLWKSILCFPMQNALRFRSECNFLRRYGEIYIDIHRLRLQTLQLLI